MWAAGRVRTVKGSEPGEGEGTRIGVCLLRVERQAGRLLITVTTTSDVARGVERVVTMVAAEAAMVRVEEFLRDFDAEAGQ